MTVEEYKPVYDTQAEEQLIGGLIVDATKWPLVAGKVSGSDFFNVSLGSVFDGIMTLAQAGKAISDIPFLTRQLSAMGVNAAEVAKIVNKSGLLVNIVYHAEEIKRLANLRKLRGIAFQLLDEACCPQTKDADAMATAKAAIESVGITGDDPAESFTTIAERVINRLRQPREQFDGKPMMTGLRSLDELNGAVRPGELVIIAARPGCGKTSLAMQITEHNAKRGRRCLFVSLEMTADELVTRTLASHAEVSSTLIRSDQIDQEGIRKLGSSAAELVGTPIEIWAPAKAKSIGIEATAKIAASQPGGLDVLIVDYIGLIEPENKRVDRPEQVAAISRSLKRMAKELRVPIIVLCQLNRESERAGVPLLSHLAESSGIEKDADMVWFIHLPEGRHKVDRDGNVKSYILVAKHRHGATGRVELNFNPGLTQFIEPSHEWNPHHA